MKTLWLAVVSLCCAFSWHCSNQSERILDIDEMKEVLVHKIMAEERFINYLNRDTLVNKDSIYTALFAGVLAYHKVDSTVFYNSLAYYKNHPEAFKTLIDSAASFAQREREKKYLEMNPDAKENASDSTGKSD